MYIACHFSLTFLACAQVWNFNTSLSIIDLCILFINYATVITISMLTIQCSVCVCACTLITFAYMNDDLAFFYLDFDSHCQSSIASIRSSPTVFSTTTISGMYVICTSLLNFDIFMCVDPGPSNKSDAGIVAIITSSVFIVILLPIIIIVLTGM